MDYLIENLIDKIGLSVFLVISIFFLVLVGILIVEFYKKKVSKKEISYFLIILVVFIIHIILDTIGHLLYQSTIIKISFVWDFILLFSSLIVFYILWKKLNRSLAYLSLLFIVLCFTIDVLLVFLTHNPPLEVLHSIFMFGIFVFLYFLIVKFLIDT